MIQIKLLDAEKNIVEEVQGEKEVNLTLRREYQEGNPWRNRTLLDAGRRCTGKISGISDGRSGV